jgi:Sensors of blue-light using FAD
MRMIFQLLYISTASRQMLGVDVESILFTARRFNQRNGITGLLISSPAHFMQVLEGDEATVRETYDRICQDPRHHAHVILREIEVEERQFGEWTMASHIVRNHEFEGAIDDIGAAVATCNVVTKSYLMGFYDRAMAA